MGPVNRLDIPGVSLRIAFSGHLTKAGIDPARLAGDDLTLVPCWQYLAPNLRTYSSVHQMLTSSVPTLVLAVLRTLDSGVLRHDARIGYRGLDPLMSSTTPVYGPWQALRFTKARHDELVSGHRDT